VRALLGQRHAETTEDGDLGFAPEGLRINQETVHVEDGGPEGRRPMSPSGFLLPHGHTVAITAEDENGRVVV
jgi:hypothetical protein